VNAGPVPLQFHDLAAIRGAAGKKAEALEALRKAFAANPKLRAQARKDQDLAPIRGEPEFAEILRP
jgi:hypothetical protein